MALRTNHGKKPAGLNSLFDALPHGRMDQRYEWFSAELTSRLFSVSDFRNIFTHHEQKLLAHEVRTLTRSGSYPLPRALRSTLYSPAVLSRLNQLVVPRLRNVSLSQLAQTIIL